MPSRMRDHDETYAQAVRDLEESPPGVVVISAEQFDRLLEVLKPMHEASLLAIELYKRGAAAAPPSSDRQPA